MDYANGQRFRMLGSYRRRVFMFSTAIFRKGREGRSGIDVGGWVFGLDFTKRVEA